MDAIGGWIVETICVVFVVAMLAGVFVPDFVGRAVEALPLAVPRSAGPRDHAGSAQTQEVTDILSSVEQAVTHARHAACGIRH